jgi:hypothetical protein
MHFHSRIAMGAVRLREMSVTTADSVLFCLHQYAGFPIAQVRLFTDAVQFQLIAIHFV